MQTTPCSDWIVHTQWLVLWTLRGEGVSCHQFPKWQVFGLLQGVLKDREGLKRHSWFHSMTEHKFLVVHASDRCEFSHVFEQDFSVTRGVHGSFLINRTRLWKGDWNSGDGMRQQNRQNSDEDRVLRKRKRRVKDATMCFT